VSTYVFGEEVLGRQMAACRRMRSQRWMTLPQMQW